MYGIIVAIRRIKKMEVIDLKCSKYIDEYIELCSLEWGEKKTKAEMQEYIKRRKNKILDGDKYISILGLINENELVGFISLFKTDGFISLVCYNVCKRKIQK